LLIVAYLIAPYYWLTGKPTRWDVSPAAIKVMKQGYCYNGAKAEKLMGHPYRPIKIGLVDFKNDHCSICNR
jgi:hypothetical protein